MIDTVVTAPGSLGDVNPLIAIARGLQSRGRRVAVAAAERYLPLVERAGLVPRVLVPEEQFARVVDDPRLWHPREGVKIILGSAGQGFLDDHYRWLAGLYHPGRTLLVSHILDFAGRIFRDANPQAAFCSVVPAPVVLRSWQAPPQLSRWSWVTKMPRPLLALGYRQVDRVVDGVLAPAINRLRTEHGLRPVRRILDRWWASPDLTLGLFPEWFSVPPSDLPLNMRCVGFPLADSGDLLPDDARARVSEALSPLRGARPIVFAPGSAHAHAKPFLAAAAEACRRLGKAGVLLSAVSHQFPSDLPSNVVTAQYLPFGELLRYAEAIVHHGGIGTTSQAFAAGLPQLILPMAFDQFDNAARVERLGCGTWLPMTRLSPARLTKRLSQVLASPAIARGAHSLAAKMTQNPVTPCGLADIILRRFQLAS